jgi:ABC-type Fe3+ transport system permease subunit
VKAVAAGARRRATAAHLAVPAPLPRLPLLRIFYDAFTDEAGGLTFAHVAAFAGDAYYRRSLWNSLLLGLGTVACTSVLGFAVAFLLVRFDFRGRDLFGYSR